jgi:hypothetical protein
MEANNITTEQPKSKEEILKPYLKRVRLHERPIGVEDGYYVSHYDALKAMQEYAVQSTPSQIPKKDTYHLNMIEPNWEEEFKELCGLDEKDPQVIAMSKIWKLLKGSCGVFNWKSKDDFDYCIPECYIDRLTVTIWKQAVIPLAQSEDKRIKELKAENQKWKNLVNVYVMNAERHKKEWSDAWDKITDLQSRIRELEGKTSKEFTRSEMMKYAHFVLFSPTPYNGTKERAEQLLTQFLNHKSKSE